ncbi:MAG: preprotein translocase subunit SecA [Gammaproteobacteria bacterium]|nr:preprotein translocase subunit SecA [Gammaproteobacteria bacterium]
MSNPARNLPWFPTRVRRVATADRQLVAEINRREARLRESSDQALRTLARELQPRAVGSEFDLQTDFLISTFAVVREVVRRTISLRLYDEQLMAGLAMTRSAVAEMATGEGKTLAATLPAVAHGLRGAGVHVMTVNQYLAQRDYHLLQPVYEYLGLSIGLVRPKSSLDSKRAAYAADITYGVGAEFGFDYLRDQLAMTQVPKTVFGGRFQARLRGEPIRESKPVQRGHAFAIVDEADSVLIDEARSALILSGSTGAPHRHPAPYVMARQVGDSLKRGIHFDYDDRAGRLALLDQGLESIFKIETTRLELQRPWASYVENALRAEHLVSRDVHYVVNDDCVQIVDQSTGRRFDDRTWSEGFHQAVEAKESVPITEESRSILRISRQRYLSFYDGLCGMTGTAAGCEEELKSIYRLSVVRIPLHKPNRRTTLSTRFFCDGDSKWNAIVKEIVRVHQSGQPILVGTRTIRDSENLADRLDENGLVYRLLSAKQDQEEADIIARAGETGAITIATNMAGRGADIKIQDAELHRGLFVLATEPHESARIDRQLSGRCARQGDSGSYRLYVAATDMLMARFAPLLSRRMRRVSAAGGEVESDFSRPLRRLQKRLDGRGFAQRQRLYREDRWRERLLKQAS